MSIFIDSSIVSEIEKYHKMGIIRGLQPIQLYV